MLLLTHRVDGPLYAVTNCVRSKLFCSSECGNYTDDQELIYIVVQYSHNTLLFPIYNERGISCPIWFFEIP